MKTQFKSLIFIAIASLFIVSCEKSNRPLYLKVTAKPLVSDDKAFIEDAKVRWQNNDEININGTPQRVIEESANKFKIPAGDPHNGGYYAAYPSTITFNSGSNTFSCSEPATYGTMPIFAYASSSGGTLNFSSPYAMIELVITNRMGFDLNTNPGDGTELTIGNSKISGGDHTVSFSAGTPVVSGASTGNSSITDYTVIPNNETVHLYIPIMPCSERGTFKIKCDGLYYKETNIMPYNFVSNHIYRINATVDNTWNEEF